MKLYSSLFAFLALFLFFSFTQTDKNKKEKKKKKYTLHGFITSTGAHCGGARLPDEQLKAMSIPHPLGNKKIFIKKGEVNTFSNSEIIAEVQTDDSGRFTVDLPAGKYILVDEKKKDRNFYDDIIAKYKMKSAYYDAVDSLCLKKWYEEPDAVVEVKCGKKKNKVTVNYATRCSWNAIPCIHYTGPLPP